MKSEVLRTLCIKNDWFTCGCNSSYERLFELIGEPVEVIATVIWVCSREDVTREEIIEKLEEKGF